MYRKSLVSITVCLLALAAGVGSVLAVNVPNGGFETGDLQVWRAHVPGGSGVISVTPNEVAERLYAAVLTRTDFSQAVQLDKWGYHYHLDAGHSYRFHFSMKKLAGEADACVRTTVQTWNGSYESYRDQG